MMRLNVSYFLDKWDLKDWIVLGFILQVFLIIILNYIYQLFPEEKKEPALISLSTDMSFIEYQEPQPQTVQNQTRELSDKIIETTQKVQDEPINWQNAVDPSLDFSQRYVAKIAVNISPDDYPDRAKRSNLGKVKVSVALYISADGKIKDVKINKIESVSGNIDLFKGDFIQAVRNIFLKKSRLLNQPYQVEGNFKDFIWYTTVTFTLE